MTLTNMNRNVLMIASAFVLLASFASSQSKEELYKSPLTSVCLGCVCQAVSGCNTTELCSGDHCGPFHITWAYWSDAGKPTNGDSPDAPEAFPNCVNELYCAARTVQGYMARYGQDCNKDNQIDCYDYLAIHKKGGFGCGGDLPYEYENIFNKCIEAVHHQHG